MATDQFRVWHPEVLPGQWLAVAARLRDSGVSTPFYLAGGTGLALQLGHRVSVDLNLFSEQGFRPQALRDRLRGAPGLKTVQMAPDSLDLQIDELKVSFLRYPYPCLFPLQQFNALDVADVRDIACMKLDTVASRGSRRDFIDLYFLCQHYSLSELLDLFATKYAAVSPNLVHMAKALTYFPDAETEPMPNMLVAVDWRQVREFFEAEVPKAFR